MDIVRQKKPSKKKYFLIGGGLAAVLLMTLALSSLEPRAPSVDRAVLLLSEVTQGTLVRQVRAPGTLVPERNVFVTAVVPGRVEALPLRPGAVVEPNTIIAVLTNPDVEMEALEAMRQLGTAESNLITLRATLEQQRLQQRSQIQQLETQLAAAQREAATFQALAAKNMAAPNEVKTRQETADELENRVRIERDRLRVLEGSIDAQIAQAERQVEQNRTIVQFNQTRRESMQVRAGEAGVLQSLPLEIGVYVNAGQQLARVAQPTRLKAELRVPGTLSRDVVIGQKVDIDTRNGIIPGSVMRVDPIEQNGTVTVEVALEGELPPGVRTDMSVDGVIEIARLPNVLKIHRPNIGQPDSRVGLFKLEPDGKHASRVTVHIGAASVSEVEVKEGLQVGDSVIVSDMSASDQVNRVRLQ